MASTLHSFPSIICSHLAPPRTSQHKQMNMETSYVKVTSPTNLLVSVPPTNPNMQFEWLRGRKEYNIIMQCNFRTIDVIRVAIFNNMSAQKWPCLRASWLPRQWGRKHASLPCSSPSKESNGGQHLNTSSGTIKHQFKATPTETLDTVLV